MKISKFGEKLTTKSGILQLMDDLGKPLPKGNPSYQLGGGNPARIHDVEKAYRIEMERILSDGESFEDVISHYDSPQGRMSFINAIATFFKKKYGWNINSDNVCITNGSQSACFYLFNLFSGTYETKGEGLGEKTKTWKKTILFPLMPEYIGYADQGIEKNCMVSVPPKCEYYEDHTMKYFVDFEAVEQYLDRHNSEGVDGQVGAMCITRPTNPSGNVLTDYEVNRLAEIAHTFKIPLLIDNAYGIPFPNIVFAENVTPIWNEDIILSMSLSKIGLPAIRTGIIIARPQLIEALSNINAIASLASGSMGQALAERLITNNKLVDMAKNTVKPYYEKKSEEIQSWIHEFFEGTNYYIHKSEGAIFVWLYLPDLKMSTIEFYAKLKNQGVITVPGEYSFFGHEVQTEGKPYPYSHYDKCLRLNYSRPSEEVKQGVSIIAKMYKQFS
ncbi:MAG: valine--pyruvate transaminase [Treponema sp. CETP13]|nr:MAG: valine--pyruvate transaminase [Treponema sp. CETP13]